jgi:hypothetical protein
MKKLVKEKKSYSTTRKNKINKNEFNDFLNIDSAFGSEINNNNHIDL